MTDDLAALREALVQARDRLEDISNHVHPLNEMTADDLHAISQDWWFGTQEIDAALSRPAPAPSLDVERLMVAVFNADQPGDWPTWDEYIAAFGSAGTPPWRRKAQRIATGYARLSAEEPQQKGQDQ